MKTVLKKTNFLTLTSDFFRIQNICRKLFNSMAAKFRKKNKLFGVTKPGSELITKTQIYQAKKKKSTFIFKYI